MASQQDKRSSGQPFKPPPAAVWNSMVDAGEAFEQSRLSGGVPSGGSTIQPAIIKVRNDTAAKRARGEVVGLNGLVTTSPTPEHFWLKGVTTRRGGRFAILRYAAPVNAIVEAQMTGVCLARVNVTNTKHRAARIPDDGTFVLQSSFTGPLDLLWCPASTGEADCVVNINHISVPVFLTPSGGIPARSGSTCGSANCTPYWIDDDGILTELKDDDGTSQAATVVNIFGSDVGASVYITAKDIFGVLAADSEDCG